MMKWKNLGLVLVAALAMNSGCAEQTNNSRDAALSLEGFEIVPYKNINNTYHVTKKSDKDVLIEEGDTRGKAKDGPWITYHKSSRSSHIPETITTYKGDKKNGLFLRIDDKNNLTERAYYVDDVLEGERMLYNRSRIKETSFYKNGKLEGERKLYYENGNDKLQEEGFFKNGERHGTSKWYDQEGNVTIEYEYDNGKKIGENKAKPVETKEEK